MSAVLYIMGGWDAQRRLGVGIMCAVCALCAATSYQIYLCSFQPESSSACTGHGPANCKDGVHQCFCNCLSSFHSIFSSFVNATTACASSSLGDRSICFQLTSITAVGVAHLSHTALHWFPINNLGVFCDLHSPKAFLMPPKAYVPGASSRPSHVLRIKPRYCHHYLGCMIGSAGATKSPREAY